MVDPKDSFVLNNSFSCNTLVPALNPSADRRAIVESGCTSHFIGPDKPCVNKVPTEHGISVRLPNGETMQYTHTALLPFPQLLLAARRAHVFPGLQNKALLSIDQFCDSNFTAVFHNSQVNLINDNTTITGQRYPSTGLYYIDLPEPLHVAPQALHPFACSAEEMKTKADMVQ